MVEKNMFNELDMFNVLDMINMLDIQGLDGFEGFQTTHRNTVLYLIHLLVASNKNTRRKSRHAVHKNISDISYKPMHASSNILEL